MIARVVAIDWSGAVRGARRRIWLAEVAVASRAVVRLEAGRDRAEIAEHLIRDAERAPELVVGLDFAFSMPAWFLEERGLPDAPALWSLAEREAEGWLAACAPPFWGRPGRRRPVLREELRDADREVPAVGAIRPKSVFQVGGAGAVGTGSLRGMPILRQLRDAGFAVWPFDAPRGPTVVEIYPRALTGAVVKTRSDARQRYLDERHPELPQTIRDVGASSEDAFDALVSALVMAAHAHELEALQASNDPRRRREGRIWVPSGETARG